MVSDKEPARLNSPQICIGCLAAPETFYRAVTPETVGWESEVYMSLIVSS